MTEIIFRIILIAVAWHFFKGSAFVLYVQKRTGKVVPLEVKASWLILFGSGLGLITSLYSLMKAFDPSL